MSKKKWFVLLVLIAVLVCCAVVVVNMNYTKTTYSNSDYGFGIQYPSTGWTLVDCSNIGYDSSSEVNVRLFDETTKADCQSKYNESRISINVYTEEQAHYYERSLNSYEEKEIAINGNIYTQISGYDILSDQYSNPPEGSAEKTIQTLFPLGNDQILVVRYGQTYHFSSNRPDMPDGTFEQKDYTPVYNDVVQSFRLEE